MRNTKVSTSALANTVEEPCRGLVRGSPPNSGAARRHVQGVIGPQAGNGVPARPIER